jgi:hypothetical protein
MTSTGPHAQAISHAAATVFAEFQALDPSDDSFTLATSAMRQIEGTSSLYVEDLSAIVAEARTLLVDESASQPHGGY